MATMIEDGHGNAITQGVASHRARTVAQEIADRRGEPVYLWMDEGEDEPEEIRPGRGPVAERKTWIYAPGGSVLTRATWTSLSGEEQDAILRRIRRAHGKTAGISVGEVRCEITRTDRHGTHVLGYASAEVARG